MSTRSPNVSTSTATFRVLMRVVSLALLLSFGWIVSAESRAATAKVEKADSWQVIYLSGQRIGYAHSSTEPFEQGGKELVRSTTIANMTINF